MQNDHIVTTLDLLSRCAIYFHSLKLATDCEAEYCTAPSECYKYNAVFNILSYLVDADFLPPNVSIFLKVVSKYFIYKH